MYEKFHAYLCTHGFQNNPMESSLYVKCKDDVFIILVYDSDDMLLIETHIVDFKVDLNATFEMSNWGLLCHYLGSWFLQCDGGIALCQTKFVETLLQCFGLQYCKPIVIPMETSLQLGLHDASNAFNVAL